MDQSSNHRKTIPSSRIQKLKLKKTSLGINNTYGINHKILQTPARLISKLWCNKKKKRNRNLSTIEKKRNEKKEKLATEEELLIQREELTLKLVSLRHTNPDLICPICLQFIVSAVNSACGHSYCEVCFEEMLLITPDCLVCEKRVRKKPVYSYCKSLDTLVEKLVLTRCSPSEKENFKKRKEEQVDRAKKKKLDKVRVGQKVDIRSKEYVWCVGIIRRIIFKHESKAKILFIHYEGFPNLLDEELSAKSSRLASHGFFTEREDIPKIKWTEEGKKMIVLRGRELGYDYLGKPEDEYSGLVDSDDSDAY